MRTDGRMLSVWLDTSKEVDIFRYLLLLCVCRRSPLYIFLLMFLFNVVYLYTHKRPVYLLFKNSEFRHKF